MRRTVTWTLFFALMVAMGLPAFACDLCGCYTPQLEAMPDSTAAGSPFGQAGPGAIMNGNWLDHAYFAVAEQFTYFGTVQVNGREVPNPTNQREYSSITQLVGGYSFTPRFALQMNVPLIYRSFQRPEGFTIDHGSEAGLGDISLLSKLVLFHYQSGGSRSVDFSIPNSPRMQVHGPDFAISALLLAGVKLPTGGTSRLKEEFNEEEVAGAPPSGIHGHDLTLGTGSYDGIFGGQTSLRYKSFFFEADNQFVVRGDGAHDYDFANDLAWSGGPGYYLVRTKQAILGLQCVCSGEHKGLDRFRERPVNDTGLTSVFLGPRLVGSYKKISCEVAAELPVSIDNTALQVVPDYRLRAAVAISF